MRRFALLGLGLAMPAALASAPAPSVLAQATPGLWELSGVPGARAPVRQCFADIAALGQYEHRNRACTHSVISDSAGTAVIQYSCGPAGFARSELHLVTPRSIKVSTQGISNQLPFNYVLQARRVGDCSKPATPPRH
jgi:hypothetical protein